MRSSHRNHRSRSWFRPMRCVVIVLLGAPLLTALLLIMRHEADDTLISVDTATESRVMQKRTAFMLRNPQAGKSVLDQEQKKDGEIQQQQQQQQSQVQFQQTSVAESVAASTPAPAAPVPAPPLNIAKIVVPPATDIPADVRNIQNLLAAKAQAALNNPAVRSAVAAASINGTQCGFLVPPVFYVAPVYEANQSPVGDAFLRAGMQQTKNMAARSGWHYSKAREERALSIMEEEEVRHPDEIRLLVNHIPMDENFHYKGLMCTNLRLYIQPSMSPLRQLEKKCFKYEHFSLVTYNLANNHECFLFEKEQKFSTTGWVSKPGTTGGHNSRGIVFWKNVQEPMENFACTHPMRSRDVVVQQVLLHPLLIKGLFFDVRMYMLVANAHPAVVFFNGGWLRLSGEALKDGEQLNSNHISTKHSPGGAVTGDERRMTFEDLQQYLDEIGHPSGPGAAERLRIMMKEMSAHVFRSVEGTLPAQKGPFALYGLDFFVDENVLPFFNEVSHSPNYKLRGSTIITSVVPQMLYDHIFLVEDVKRQIKCRGRYVPGATGVWEIIINDSVSPPFFIDQKETCKRVGIA